MSRVSQFGVKTVLVGIVMLAVVVLVASVGPAQAAFPGQNGKIAFVKENYRKGTSAIFAINPDGSEQSRLGPGYSPSYSADGTKVVFERYGEEDSDSDIWVMDADGSDLQQITSSPAYDYYPSFFPEGDKIAFIRESRKNGTDIFTINLNGTGLTKLTDSPTFYEETLSVSPEGDKIAFSRYNRSSDIFVMNSDGTDPQNLTRTGRIDEFGPDWSPDSLKIAFTSYRFNFGVLESGGVAGKEALAPEALAQESRASDEPQEEAEISVMDADGNNRKDLTSGPALDVLPAFSPDGTRIAFSKVSVSRDSEKSDIFTMRADGTRKRQLTDTTRAVEWGADWQPIPSTGATPQ